MARRRRWGRSARAAACRLDALAPPPPAEANLAGLLAGHEGALAWVESVVLLAAPAPTPASAGAAARMPPACSAVAAYDASDASDADGAGPGPGGADAYPAEARALDAQLKDVFDPAGLYPDAPPP